MDRLDGECADGRRGQPGLGPPGSVRARVDAMVGARGDEWQGEGEDAHIAPFQPRCARPGCSTVVARQGSPAPGPRQDEAIGVGAEADRVDRDPAGVNRGPGRPTVGRLQERAL